MENNTSENYKFLINQLMENLLFFPFS